MQLTDDQKSFFMDMDNLFNSRGWARLTQGWKQEAASLPEAAFYNAKSMEDLEADKVRMRLLQELIALPEQISRMRQELEQGNE